MLISGKEKLERMRDGRAVYIGAERVDDVTRHPAFRNAARTIADLYELKADPQQRELFSFEENGERYGLPWLRCRTREDLARRGLEPDLEAVMLVSLMEAADRVDSTVGLQMAWLKAWARRSNDDLALRVPDVLDGPGRATCTDAREAAAAGEYDLVYADPPYNQHKYLGNYHVWETLIRWDRPEVYGIARKRVDCRDYRSPYNSTRVIHAELRALCRCARCAGEPDYPISGR